MYVYDGDVAVTCAQNAVAVGAYDAAGEGY